MNTCTAVARVHLDLPVSNTDLGGVIQVAHGKGGAQHRNLHWPGVDLKGPRAVTCHVKIGLAAQEVCDALAPVNVTGKGTVGIEHHLRAVGQIKALPLADCRHVISAPVEQHIALHQHAQHQQYRGRHRQCARPASPGRRHGTSLQLRRRIHQRRRLPAGTGVLKGRPVRGRLGQPGIKARQRRSVGIFQRQQPVQRLALQRLAVGRVGSGLGHWPALVITGVHSGLWGG